MKQFPAILPLLSLIVVLSPPQALAQFPDSGLVPGAAVATTTAAEHIRRGKVLQGQGKFQQATLEYDQAIRLDSGSVLAHYNLGVAQSALKRYQMATEALDIAIALKPDFAQAYVDRGLIRLLWFPGPISAIADFEQALLLNPNDGRAHLGRGQARQTLVKGRNCAFRSRNFKYHWCEQQIQRIIEDYNQAIARLHEPALLTVAYLYRGMAHLWQEDKLDALADLDEAIRLDPNSADAYYHRGEVRLLAQGNFREDWQKAIVLYRAQGDVGSGEKLTKLLESVASQN